jgi:signal transduction histidine kinase
VPLILPPAWADTGLIARVLQNLVGNAIKFTPPNGVIRVSARTEEKQRGSVILVAVRDTGPGIPPEIAGRLFQKFVTGRQTGRGSGLGLAFCKLTVEAHGGRIWVESTPGNGATFTFSLATALGP